MKRAGTLTYLYLKIEGDINVKGHYCAFKLVFIAFFKSQNRISLYGGISYSPYCAGLV